jgi:hypothetical protein
MNIILVIGSRDIDELLPVITTSVSLYNKISMERKTIIIASGGNSGEYELSESYMIKERMLQLELPSNDIIEEPYSLNPAEQIVFSREIMKSLLKNSDNETVNSSIVYIVCSKYMVPVIQFIIEKVKLRCSIDYIPVSEGYPYYKESNTNPLLYEYILERYRRFHLGSEAKTKRLQCNKFSQWCSGILIYKPIY